MYFYGVSIPPKDFYVIGLPRHVTIMFNVNVTTWIFMNIMNHESATWGLCNQKKIPGHDYHQKSKLLGINVEIMRDLRKKKLSSSSSPLSRFS